MFDWIPAVCGELRREMIGLYWAVLPTLVLLTIIFEFFKDEMDVKGIAKRAFLSALLLVGFDSIVNLIFFMAGGIVDRINEGSTVSMALERLQESFTEEKPGLLRFREMLIYTINLGCYLFALLSFYMTDVHWRILSMPYLYITSPLLTSLHDTQGNRPTSYKKSFQGDSSP